MFDKELNCLQYGNTTTLHVFTGNGTFRITVSLQSYMIEKELNCLHYGDIATLHVFTGTGTECSTKTLQRYMFVQGMELSALP